MNVANVNQQFSNLLGIISEAAGCHVTDCLVLLCPFFCFDFCISVLHVLG